MIMQGFTGGQIIGKHPTNSRIVFVYDGFFTIPVYITGDPSLAQEGLFYNVYNQNGIFILGACMPKTIDFTPTPTETQ